MGIFAGLNEARVSGGGQYYDQIGEFRSKVTLMKGFMSKKKTPCFVGEHIVTASTNDKIRAGERRNFFADLSEPWGFANMKEYLAAVNGLNIHDPVDAKAIEAQDWEAIAEEATGESNPLADEELIVIVYAKATKKGTMGTRTKFIPTPENSAKARAVGK